MDLREIIAELRREHARLSQVILAIEAIERGQNVDKDGLEVKRGRGRPPGSRNKPKPVHMKKPSPRGSDSEASGTEGGRH